MKAERQQQQAEELCGASIRALTGQADLRYRGRRLHKGEQPVAARAPHLRTNPEIDDFRAYRGAADGVALRLQLSDGDLYKSQIPEDPIQRFLFEMLEQLRVESLVPDAYPGMRHNLRYRFAQWSLDYHRLRITEGNVGILIYTLLQVVWSRLNGYAVLVETEGLIEETRFNLTSVIGELLVSLRHHRDDQRKYAAYALQISQIIAELVDTEIPAELGKVADDNHQESSPLARIIDLDGDDELDAIASVFSGESRVLAGANGAYKVFTHQYDRELQASCLVRPEYLRKLREQLDKHIQGQGVNLPRLARRLAELLAAPMRNGWAFGEEEGYIDARRLSQLIVSPGERHLFKQELYRSHANCLVSILIDCSGSMKEHIEPVAVLVDVLGRALEQAGASTEILGYTTGAWNGGQCQKEWYMRGRPDHPGRLNELCHLVYKDADTSWRLARPAIAALLKADLFREGIDGEALEWACHRMLGRSEQRRILITISDGCPMDTATNIANDRFYLDNHLKQVVGQLEQRDEVEIYGLGVGLDLSPYYTHYLALDLSQTPSNQVFEEILQLLASRRHH